MNKASIDIPVLATFVQHDKLEVKSETFGTGNPEIRMPGCNF
jgi:hypothetical protein